MGNDTENDGKDKRKAKRKPVSKEQWRERHKKAADDAGFWAILPRDMHASDAWLELTPGGRTYVLAMLDKLEYKPEPKRKRKQRNTPRKLCREELKEEGRFTLTNNELHARGLGSGDTISDARLLVWELGFCDTLATGVFLRKGFFQYSERWRHYPDGPYKPVGQPRPGKCLYPAKTQPRSKRTSEIEVESLTTEIEVKDSAKKSLPSNETNHLEDCSTLQKLKLFYKLTEECAGTVGATDGHEEMPTRGNRDPKRPGRDTGEVCGDSELYPRNLREGETTEQYLIEFMTSLGLTCTQHQQQDKNTILTFSDRSTIRIGRYITYTDPDGKNYPDYVLPHELKLKLPVNDIRARAQLTAIARQVEESMFNHGYGHCVSARPSRREIYMKFGGEVHAWVMDGSIMVDRPGYKRLKVKAPDNLEKVLTEERLIRKANTVEAY